MKRRQFITVIGTTAVASIAGCTGGSDDENSSYGEEQKEDMYLTADDFPQGWHDISDQDLNGDFEKEFINHENPDEADRMVLMDIKIAEDADEASSDLESSRERFRNPQDLSDIGDDAFWGEADSFAYALFRDNNAVAQVVAGQQNGFEFSPWQGMAIDMAEQLHEHWQEQ